MFVSCNRPEDDTLEKITDTIIGKYMCKSATIQDGHLLDIDGNGIVSDDVIAEFERLEAAFWAIKDRPVRISPVKEYGQVANINIEIPKQRFSSQRLSFPDNLRAHRSPSLQDKLFHIGE